MGLHTSNAGRGIEPEIFKFELVPSDKVKLAPFIGDALLLEGEPHLGRANRSSPIV